MDADMKFNKQRWAYLAGLFDGEGSVYMRKNDRTKHKCKGFTYQMGVTVICGTDENLVRTIMGWFGKDTLEISKYGTKRPMNRQGYRFRLHSRQALVFLEKVLPYLITKKERAVLAIKFQKQRKHQPFLSDKERSEMEKSFQLLKKLNLRGLHG